ncbi:MAG: AMP-binding protein [Solirubrobacterales bacterium]|nr:AMP-binding protein [Solirubrobacterales bacterium]
MQSATIHEIEQPTASVSCERGPTDSPLLEETIGQRLRRVTERFGDREALVVGHQNYRATYNQLSEQVELAARALITNGVRKGDRVGIWAPNRYEWVIVQFATARVGAILVTINPAYKVTELRYALRRAGVSVLFAARGFRGADYLAMLAQARADCPDLRQIVVLDGEWQAFLAEGARLDPRRLTEREASLNPSDAINIQYTSGTTGLPKGATLSHRNILNNGHFNAEVLRYTEHDRVCVPVPFYHCFGMVVGSLAAMTHGACVVVPGESFDALAVLKTVQAERCTSLYGVPTMFIAELSEPELETFDLTSLRTGIMAGAPCPVEVIKHVRARMHIEQITIGCGMTETAPIATQLRIDDPEDKRLTTVGRPHPHVEVKIVDPATGSTVPRGTAGEQCTRGYNVMLGYWNDPGATARAVDSDGWMHTGDLAVMDEDGYVSIVGRIKDMIIRGGENIYPREVEEFLYTLPQIDLVEVIGIPSEQYGEEVMAWVRLREGTTATAEELIAACRGRIATYKIPRHWKFVDSFPMTVTGKTQKFRMREIAIGELGLKVAA